MLTRCVSGRRAVLATVGGGATASLAAAAAAAACSAATGTPRRDQFPTALEALGLLLPLLQRKHGHGVVAGISSLDDEPRDARFAVWGVTVWVPEDVSDLVYRVVRGEPRAGPGGSLRQVRGDPLTAPPALMRLNGEQVPRVIDSDRAVAIAEEAGGREFRRRTGAHVQSASLRPRDDGRSTWRLFYTRFYTTSQASVEIDVDTGEIIGVEGGIAVPTPTPR